MAQQRRNPRFTSPESAIASHRWEHGTRNSARRRRRRQQACGAVAIGSAFIFACLVLIYHLNGTLQARYVEQAARREFPGIPGRPGWKGSPM